MAAMTHVQPVGGVTGSDIPNDRRYANIAYYGMVDYPPQPLRVSDSTYTYLIFCILITDDIR
jgi:hypothetical protein